MTNEQSLESKSRVHQFEINEDDTHTRGTRTLSAAFRKTVIHTHTHTRALADKHTASLGAVTLDRNNGDNTNPDR